MARWLTLTLFIVTTCLTSGDLGISVVTPTTLKAKYTNGITGRMGSFGQFPYGSYVYGELTIAAGMGCSSLNSALGTIFLIKRGSCLFADKVLNAQNAGAKAVIVYNDVSTGLVTMGGRPTSIRIPAVFISYGDGTSLLNADSTVVLNLTFALTSKATPSLSLVFSLSSKDSQLGNLISTVHAFSGPVSILYNITSCIGCKAGLISANCLGNGRYCASSANSPKESLIEVIRQQCVLEQANTQGLLAYLEAWFSSCSMNTPCEAGYTQANVRSTAVDACVKNSYQNSIDDDLNTKLQAAQDSYKLLSTNDTPAVLVSEELFAGDFTLSNLQRAVCSVQPKSLSNCTNYFCSSGCWNDMLMNSFCDSACNVTLCNSDSHVCDYKPLNTTPAVNTTVCSPGCTSEKLLGNVCYPVCDNEACKWGNGICRCSASCTKAMSQDTVCDQVCNTIDCNFDNGACIMDPEDPTDTDSEEDGSDGSSGLSPEIWIAIALSIVGFGLLVACLIVLGCWLKKRRQLRANRPRSPINIVVPPDRPSVDQVLAMLGKRAFVPEMIEFGGTSCVVCLSDFTPGEEVVKTTCRHLFHFSCLREWFVRHQHCPICKQDPLSFDDDTNPNVASS